MNQAAYRGMTEIDRLIHEPARLVITTILYIVKEADFIYLLQESGLTRGNLSSHLSKLEEAGYIEIQKTFREKKPLTICSMTPKGRTAFENYRDQYNQIMQKTSEEH